VFLPDGEEWLGEFVDEFADFPLGRHDDMVDSTSQMLNYWRLHSWHGTVAQPTPRVRVGLARDDI
jgi:phage terminase large subunit-like protein